MRELSAVEWNRVVSALRIATDVYREDAKGTAEIAPSVSAQFDRQADMALLLAIEIEDREDI